MKPRRCTSIFLFLLSASVASGTITTIDNSYAVDDGEFNGGLSPSGANGFVILNRFQVRAGLETITEVEINWFRLNESAFVTAGVWSDPNQDGDPRDGGILGRSAPLLAQGERVFQGFPLLTPTIIGPEGTSFFVGAFYRGSLSVAFDQSFPQGPYTPSWFVETGGSPDPRNLSTARSLLTVDSGGAVFGIRARGAPIPEAGAVAFLAAAGLFGLARRQRQGSAGGSPART